MVGSRLYRMRRFLGPPRALEAIAKLFMVSGCAVMRELVNNRPRPGACGVGDCARLPPTIGDPRETSGPRIDRIPLARPPYTVGRPRPRIKKISFLGPSTCPIDLFGPVANRRVLKRLHARSEFCLLVSYQAASFSSLAARKSCYAQASVATRQGQTLRAALNAWLQPQKPGSSSSAPAGGRKAGTSATCTATRTRRSLPSSIPARRRGRPSARSYPSKSSV